MRRIPKSVMIPTINIVSSDPMWGIPKPIMEIKDDDFNHYENWKRELEEGRVPAPTCPAQKVLTKS
jgi:hypothetical protein